MAGSKARVDVQFTQEESLRENQGSENALLRRNRWTTQGVSP